MKTKESIWRDALSGYSESGLSLQRYCSEHSLNYSSAQYWLRRLSKLNNANQVHFSVIECSEAFQNGESGVTLSFGSFRISLKRKFDDTVLTRVLDILSRREE